MSKNGSDISVSPFAFNSLSLFAVTHEGQIWLAEFDLSLALGYTRKSHFDALYDRVVHELEVGMKKTVHIPDRGMTKIFTLPGCMRLAAYSKAKHAARFKHYVARLLRSKDHELVSVPPTPAAPATPAEQPMPDAERLRPFDGKYPDDMYAGRKRAMQRIEKILADFRALRSDVQICCHPGGHSLIMSKDEKERYSVLVDLYRTADFNLAAAFNALEAGYRLGKQVGFRPI